MKTQTVKGHRHGVLWASGIMVSFVTVGCSGGGPESVGEQGTAFTGGTALTDAKNWCTGDNGGTPAPQTFSGTSHAATFYGEIQEIEAAVVTSTYTSSTTSQIDESIGKYNVDCSSFGDYAMCDTMVDTLANVGGSGRPAELFDQA